LRVAVSPLRGERLLLLLVTSLSSGQKCTQASLCQTWGVVYPDKSKQTVRCVTRASDLFAAVIGRRASPPDLPRGRALQRTKLFTLKTFNTKMLRIIEVLSSKILALYMPNAFKVWESEVGLF
jgi:hypothetical protein